MEHCSDVEGVSRLLAKGEKVMTATLSTVRMYLEDYDAAPDGVGTYVKLNAGFPDVKSALDYKRWSLHNMYWGALYDVQGNLISILDEEI
jgi:hypothetical protein